MTRKEEILNIVGNDPIMVQTVEDMIYLEKQLDILRGLPKLRVDETDPMKQKATPAAKMYKEYLQQYINVVKVLLKATGTDAEEEDSPLRKWMKAHVD